MANTLIIKSILHESRFSLFGSAKKKNSNVYPFLMYCRESRNNEGKEEKEEKPFGEQVKEFCRDLWTAFKQPTLILLVIAASVRQIAGLAWANNNVLYFDQYYSDKQVIQ